MEVVEEILKHLGGPAEGFTPEESLLSQIRCAIAEVERLADFRYVYAHFSAVPEFLIHQDAYLRYLAGAEGVVLCATTLGATIDRYIHRLQVSDMSMAVVVDAAASVMLERWADDFERQLPYQPLGFRFCPGYEGTPLTDSRAIAQCVRAETIGITFLDSNLMLPSKSMTGFIKVGAPIAKTCRGCLLAGSCSYRAKGATCYGK